ncbi:MAG: NADH-quinone oxidoreductase subunit C [Prolixibacteraceae bacterium]|nr:NADH-quinone oxidoreductase subunit C [Prolixibacteraceae bacterium]
MKKFIEDLGYKFVLSKVEYQRKNLTFVTVDKENTVQLLSYLRDYEGFKHFVLMTAVDWLEDGLFQITYILNNPEKKIDLAIRTKILREKAKMTTAHHLWNQVATYQRELKEMFGIDFPGSPRVNESFILEGWDNIPPMRRDFDTKKYAEETYFPRPGRSTNDPSEYMKQKLYPNE